MKYRSLSKSEAEHYLRHAGIDGSEFDQEVIEPDRSEYVAAVRLFEEELPKYQAEIQLGDEGVLYLGDKVEDEEFGYFLQVIVSKREALSPRLIDFLYELLGRLDSRFRLILRFEYNLHGANFALFFEHDRLCYYVADGESAGCLGLEIADFDKGGRTLWSFQAGGEISSAPVIGGDKLFLASDGNLYAIDIGSGKEIWSFEAAEYILGSPLFVDGTVYVTDYGTLLAIDAEVGEVKWKLETPSGFVSHGSPIHHNGHIYFGSGPSLYKVAANNGEEVWSIKLGSQTSSPAYSGERIFCGCGDGCLYAIDDRSGRVKWKFKTKDSNDRSTPTIKGGTVFSGSEDRHLYAVDERTGKMKWKYQCTFCIHESSPVIEEDTVYFGDGDGYFHAVSLDTGKKKWRFPALDAVNTTPAIADGVIYFGSADGHLYGVDLETGAERWKYSAESKVNGSPLVTGGVVYFGSDSGKLFAAKAFTKDEHESTEGAEGGSMDWETYPSMYRNGPGHPGAFTGIAPRTAPALAYRFETRGEVHSSPVVYGRIVCFGSDDGRLYALDLESGAALWSYQAGPALVNPEIAGAIRGSAAIAKDVIYFGANDGLFRAVDVETGKERWVYEAGWPIEGSPVLAGGLVFIAGENVLALDAKTGGEAWKIETGMECGPDSSPAFDGGVLYYTSSDNHLYAVDALTGRQRWGFPVRNYCLAPALLDGVIFCGNYGGELFAIDCETRRELWNFRNLQAEKIFGSTALEADDPSAFGSPALVKDRLLVGDADGYMYCLVPATGELRWKFKARDGIVSNPSVVGNVVYFSSGDCHLYAVDIETGKELWKYRTEKVVYSSPCAANGMILFGCSDGNLYALKA